MDANIAGWDDSKASYFGAGCMYDRLISNKTQVVVHTMV
jgi:hypothetical protein